MVGELGIRYIQGFHYHPLDFRKDLISMSKN